MNKSVLKNVARYNQWREQYNPLRGLTIRRAIALLESYNRGEMADLQWAFYHIEQTDEDLIALVERRLAALLEMDWNIKIMSEPKRKSDFDEKLAEDQAAALREAYDRIDNLYEGIEHLAMATFRGYSHVEKQTRFDGEVVHLEPVDQWNVVRDGFKGAWRYNPEARSTSFAGLSGMPILEPEIFLTRTVTRMVDRIGLIKFIRQNLSQKDWDAFVEIYGIPSGVVIMPPQVPEGKEEEYEDAAREVAQGGDGALPHGSDYKTNDQPRGTNPFEAHLEFLQKKLVLAGTGGLLTMLAESGSGTLAGSAHMEAFRMIARGEARRIGELFQKCLDKSLLEQSFPDRPVLAYFEIAADEEQDIGEVCKEIETLHRAGYRVSDDEVSERTGYTVTSIESKPEADPEDPTDPAATDPESEEEIQNRMLPQWLLKIFNRESDGAPALKDNALAEAMGVTPQWLAPVDDIWREMITKVQDESISDDDLLEFLDEASARLPELFGEMDSEGLAETLEAALGTATVAGLTEALKRERTTKNGNL